MLIHSESASFSLPFLQAKAFPRLQIPFPEDTIRVQGLNDLFHKTMFAADGKTTDPAKVSLQYVRLAFADGLTTAEATNGLSVALATSPHCADGNLELLLHEKAVRILSSIVNSSDELFVGISGKYAVFMKEDLFFSSMMFAGKYLAGSRILERVQPAYQAMTDAGSLTDQIQNVSALFLEGDDPCVDLYIESDNITLRAETASGHSSSAVKAADTTPTPKDGFHFDCRLLLSCLRNTSGPLRLLLDENGLLILEANQCRYFVCPRGPVRIVKKEVEKAVKTPRAKKSKNKTQTTTKRHKEANYMQFEPGRLTATYGISAAMEDDTAFQRFVAASLNRYQSCDWGELSTRDCEANNAAVANGENRIFAAYVSKELQKKIWIITEADRSYTTVMLPQEY